MNIFTKWMIPARAWFQRKIENSTRISLSSPQHPRRRRTELLKVCSFPSVFFRLPSSFLRLCYTLSHYAKQNYAWCECTFTVSLKLTSQPFKFQSLNIFASHWIP